MQMPIPAPLHCASPGRATAHCPDTDAPLPLHSLAHPCRFTDFYRAADLPPRRPRPHGRPDTLYSLMPMPSSTPAPILTSNNPLPLLPADVWRTPPYRHVLTNLPTEPPDLLDLQHRSKMLVGDPEPVPRPSSFGSRDKGKKPPMGLFRSRSTSGQSDVWVSSSLSRQGHTQAQTVTATVIPPAGGAITSTINMPQPHAANAARPHGWHADQV